MKQTYSHPPVPLGILNRGDAFFRINAGVSLKSAEIAAPVSLVEPLGSESIVRLSVDAPRMGAGDPDAAGAIGNVNAVGRHSHSYLTIRGEGHGSHHSAFATIRPIPPTGEKQLPVAVTSRSSSPARRPNSMI